MLATRGIDRLKFAALAAVFFAFSSAAARAAEPPHVVVVEARPASDESTPPVRRGLGFVVESDGFVLTAYENLTDPESGRLLAEITVATLGAPEAEPLPAQIVSVEPTLNLGILKVEPGAPLRASKIRRDRGLEVGETVFAVTGLGPGGATIARGRLSELSSKECYQQSMTATMVRAEIELPRSAMGTPLYGADGSVVALYTGYEPAAEAAAGSEAHDDVHVLPIVLVFNIYDSIKRRTSVISPWTGFSVRRLEAEEAAMFPTARGHRGGIAIEYVWPGGPAERMGIRTGDVLVQLAYSPITSPADFQKWLYAYGVGHEIKLIFVRDGKQYLAVDYVIEERPGWAKPR